MANLTSLHHAGHRGGCDGGLARVSDHRPETPAAGAVNQLTAQEKKAGWMLLFDGKSLNGWRGYKKPDASDSRWRVEDGLLTVDPGTGKDTRGQRDIITTRHFDRFELAWEWRVAEGGNSGLKYFVLEDHGFGHRPRVPAHRRRAARRREDRPPPPDGCAL